MYKKMTKLIGSALLLLALLPLSTAALAVFNLMIPVDSQPPNVTVIVLTLPGQNLDTTKNTYESERREGFFIFGGMPDKHGDIDWIAWKQDAKGNLVGRERWPLRDGHWIQANLLVLDGEDGYFESSYCSPSCEYPSSVKTKAGYWVPVVVLGASAILLGDDDDGNGSSANGQSGGGGAITPTPSQLFIGRWLGSYSGPGNGSLDITVDGQGNVTGVAGGPGAGPLSGSVNGNTGGINFNGGGHAYSGLLGRNGQGNGNFTVNGTNLVGSWILQLR